MQQDQDPSASGRAPARAEPGAAGAANAASLAQTGPAAGAPPGVRAAPNPVPAPSAGGAVAGTRAALDPPAEAPSASSSPPPISLPPPSGRDPAFTRIDSPPTLAENPVPDPAGAGAAAGAAAAATPPGALPSLDRYEILEELGRGAMGVVYRARQKGLDRVVALKLLLGGGTQAGPAELERFHREARAAARLHHPGIVEVFDVGELGGRPYIAMEFVAGCSLDQHLARHAPPMRDRIELLRRVAEAVEHAHAHGIVHRDLKPANVLVDGAGHPHVADFGLAKEARDGEQPLTRSGMILGTPEYMSPEQVDGNVRRIDARSDVFSLGVMLYELLAGCRPFQADGMVALLVKILCEEAVAPRRRNPNVHVDLETVCLKALEKEPARRYVSAGAFARDLGHFLAGEPIEARPASLATRVWKRLKRSPVVAGLALALALAGGTLGTVAWRARTRDLESARAHEGLVAGYLQELARSGAAVVDAALARRALGDVKGCRAYAASLEEPVHKLIELAPERPEPWYHRGRLERALEHPREAEAAQGRAVELAEAAGGAGADRSVLAGALYERGVLRALRYEESVVQAADALLRQRAAALPPEAPPPEPLGPEAVEAERPELGVLRQAAARDLGRVAESAGVPAGAPAEGRALAARGIALLLSGGRPTEAEALLERALAADPYLPEAHATLAHIAEREEAWEKAAVRYEHGAQADRGYIPHLLDLALALTNAASRAGRHGQEPEPLRQRAVTSLERAVELDPGRELAWSLLARVHLDRARERGRRREDAEDALRRAQEAAEQADRIATALCAPASPSAGAARSPGGILRPGAPPPGSGLSADAADAVSDAAACLGAVHKARADAQSARGEDPVPELRRAQSDCERALAARPDDPMTLFDLGKVHEGIGEWRRAQDQDPGADYATATAVYERFAALRPRLAQGPNGRARVAQQQGLWRARRGEDPRADYLRAAAGYQQAIALDPRSAIYEGNLASVRQSLGVWSSGHGADPGPDFEAAAAGYERALRLDPTYASALLGAAKLHKVVGQARAARGLDPGTEYDGAIADYRRLLEAHPGEVEAATDLAGILLARAEGRAAGGQDPAGDLEAARVACLQAEAARPGHLQALRYRAGAALLLARWQRRTGADPAPAVEQALDLFGQVLVRAPHDPEALGNRCTVLAARADLRVARGEDPTPDFHQALADADALVKEDPRDALGWNNRGSVVQGIGDWRQGRGEDPSAEYTRAAEDYAEAARCNPRLWLAAVNRALVLQARGDWRKAHGADPTGDWAEAERAYLRCLELQPGHAEVTLRLGAAAQAIGDWRRAHGGEAAEAYARALEAYGRAARLAPRSWQAPANRGLVLEALGRPGEARAAYEEALRIAPGQAEVTRLLDRLRAPVGTK